jgi:enolase
MIGTLTDAYEFIRLAKKNNIITIISPRTGDTCDTTLSHLGVGWQVELLKTGGALGGERIAKVNELIRIEEALGDRCSMVQFES